MAPAPRELDEPPMALLQSLRKHSLVTIVLAFISVLLASVLMSGWPGGLIPNLAIPYIFQGDGLSHAWLIQRTIESPWYFLNYRNGYPFGSSMLDYPSSDLGNFAVIKLLGWGFKTWYATLNTYFLLGFAITAAVTFGVVNSFRINTFYAVCAALIFTFLPYHFLRLAHIFYTWYFVVPVYFYYAYKLFYVPKDYGPSTLLKRRSTYFHVSALIICSCFGVYFAFFGCLVLLCAGFIAAIQQRRIFVFFLGCSCALAVATGVGINVMPNLLYTISKGSNTSVAERSPGDSEVYGLKIDQMLLPRENHRIETFAKATKRYERSFPLVNENSTATLGMFGALGFLALLTCSFLSIAGVRLKRILSLLSGVTIFLLLVATVGGFSSLFAIFVSASIRGWNRISVFIAFASIVTSIVLIDYVFRKNSKFITPLVGSILVAATATLAVLDQTTPACHKCNTLRAGDFLAQKSFFGTLEQSLPLGSAVFQLPYISFPEVPDLYGVSSYDELRGFLFTHAIEWSHGGMAGRPGDYFYRELSKKPLSDQLIVARRLGFAGLTMNLSGYADQGSEEEKALTSAIGNPTVKSADGKILFYRLHDVSPKIAKGTSPAVVYRLAEGALRDAGRSASESGFETNNGLDFSQDYLPMLSQLQGLSGVEPWGRWSDARLSDHVSIIYKANLPTHLLFSITALAYGPSVGIPVRITIGNCTQYVILSATMSTKKLTCDTGVASNEIDIYPPDPVSPSGDPRLISIGIKEIQVLRAGR